MALAELVANERKPLEGFGLFGVIKETGVDDEGLAEFSEFFPYPLYRDENIAFYKALGNRKLSFTLNPFHIVGGMFTLASSVLRLKQRKIGGNMIGEGIRQGGVIMFDKDGKQMYAYEEETAKDLPLEDILAAVKAIKEGK